MTDPTALALGASTATTTPFPEIVLLEDNLDGSDSLPTVRGSGVIIGPHTILTAAHVVWDSDTGTDASSILAFPGYNGSGDPLYTGTAPVAGSWRLHYNQIVDTGDQISPSQSQLDFAVLDYAGTFPTWFQMAPNFGGGTVRIDGYPVVTSVFSSSSINWQQVNRSGTVQADPTYSVLDNLSLSPIPGDSGGPLWYNAGTGASPQNTVVGLVSTGGFSGGYSVQLTQADINQINSWIAQDASLWTGTPGATSVAPTKTDALDFDAAWYLEANPDVANAINAGQALDPERHYLGNGWKEGRNPDQLFNSAWYLAHNPDVAAAGLDPLVHFATTGWREGRDPSAQFSIATYDRLNPDIAAAAIDPLHHYLNTGAREGRRYI